MRFSANGARGRLASLLLGMVLLLSGCADTLETKAMDVVEWVEVKSSDFIDNHEYKEFPWEILLTEEDRELLNQPEIPMLKGIDLSNYDVVETVDHINKIIDETNQYVNSFELYEENIHDSDTVSLPLNEIYKSDEADVLFLEQIEDMYNRSYTFPDHLDMVMLEQKFENDEHMWVVHMEWKALQDSNEFLVYPLTIKLNDKFEYISGVAKEPISSAVFTRPFDTDSVISNQSHVEFLDVWKEFSKMFDNKTKETEDLDNSHIASIASESMEESTLNDLFEATRGYLSNGSFTAWKMNDKEADALSYYTFSVPVDHKGTVQRFEIVYSRPYERIEGIRAVK